MITQFGIHLKVKDIMKSLRFYQKFQLKPIFAYGSEEFLINFDKALPTIKEKYNGVTFEIGGALFEVADGHLAVKPEVFNESIQSSKVSAMLKVPSVDEIVKICEAESIPLEAPPRIFPWRTKEVVIKDPDGFVLVFISPHTPDSS